MKTRSAWACWSFLLASALSCGRAIRHQEAPVDAGTDGGCDAGCVACPSRFVSCEGRCLDPRSSTVHCGARADCAGGSAGQRCAAGEICAAGTCVVSCQQAAGAELIACAGVCIDPRTSPAHCGASGDCIGPRAGGCAPGESCVAGACAPIPCAAPLATCAGICVDTRSDPAHCGACGQACPSGQACLDGRCSLDVATCGTPKLLAPTASNTFRAATAASGADVAIVAWLDGSSPVLWASIWDPAARVWGDGRAIYDAGSASYSIADLQVAIGAAGAGAAAAIMTYDGVGFGAGVSRLDPVVGSWGTTQLASSDGHDVSRGAIAASDTGAVLLVGRQGTSSVLVARRYEPRSASWLATETLTAGLAADASFGHVPFDVTWGAGGQAIVVWPEGNGGADAGAGSATITARRLGAPDGVWSPPETIGPVSGDGAIQMWSTLGANSDAAAVWWTLELSATQQGVTVWANHFDAAAGVWGAAQRIGQIDGYLAARPLAIDGSGNAVVIGNSLPATDGTAFSFWSDRFHPVGGGWQPARTDPNLYIEVGPLAMNGRGDAIVFYADYSSGVPTALFRRSTGGADVWGASQRAPGRVGQVALSATGTALTVWTDSVPTALGGGVPALWSAWCEP